MISERQLAAGFSGFWSELLPLLTPNFVRLFNEAYCRQLTDEDGVPVGAIPKCEDTLNPAIVAEMAFHLARLAHERGLAVEEATELAAICDDAERHALELVDQYEGPAVEEGRDPELSEAERGEAKQLSLQYSHFIRGLQPRGELVFEPRIHGSGFVSSVRGDIAVDDGLFEVKTVNRNIAGKDLRQLFVYLALRSADSAPVWPNAGFFNPRTGLIFEFSVGTLLLRLSGGRASGQVFAEMLDFFSLRDVEIDSPF